MESSASVRCRRHTKRRRDSKLEKVRKTAEVKYARQGRKGNNASVAKVTIASPRKSPIPFRLGL